MREPDVSNLVTVSQAIELIDAEPVEPHVIELPLAQADGLILAEDVKADRDYPPFDKSQMDGFAVRCADSTAGAEMSVIGEIAAGDWPARTVQAGQAVAIMTGAPMPPGADGVVPVEDATREGDRVRIQTAPRPGRFIAPRGSDVKAGATVLGRGMKLGPAQLAVAASVGAAKIKVFARPSVAVLTTGNELVEIDQNPDQAQIRNSNNLMLVSLLGRLGCDVKDLGIARDDPEAISATIEQGLRSDVLCVTGGMSMGSYDYVPRILLEKSVAFRVTKLRVKPGKPFVFGVAPRRSFVFGLPGNPLSGYVCVVRLASRLIARLRGEMPTERWIEAKLSTDLPANGPREFYQPAWIQQGIARILQWKGSADIYTLSQANALVVRGENEGAKRAGELVKALEIPS